MPTDPFPLFQDYALLGDSRAIGFYYSEFLEESRVLADGGNTVVVIEHNLDVIKTADYIIDIGPEGGLRGGTVIAQGTPEEIAESPVSYTGHYVARMLENGKKSNL